jgi:hypothetical protein
VLEGDDMCVTVDLAAASAQCIALLICSSRRLQPSDITGDHEHDTCHECYLEGRYKHFLGLSVFLRCFLVG